MNNFHKSELNGTNHIHSLMAIDPWGEMLLDMGTDAGLGFAEIDRARVAEIRSRVPAIAHRRAIPPAEVIG